MPEYLLIMIIAGAIGGLVRTFYFRNGNIVWPTINIRKRRIKLGFIASMVFGAVAAFLVGMGLVSFVPTEFPNHLSSSLVMGVFSGLVSLSIINKAVGMRIKDPDTTIMGCALAPKGEINYYKLRMYKAIEEEVSCAERVLITDGSIAGVIRIVAVPRKGHDALRVRSKVERAVHKIKPPGVQCYVRTPSEINVDLSLFVEVLDGENVDATKAKHSRRIKEVVSKYIDSLQPGEAVLQSQIIGEIVSSSQLVKDVISSKMISSPPFEQGRIRIGRFEVARAKDILVNITVRTIG